jgi:branched-chain amino acid transport system ATP-binding protein
MFGLVRISEGTVLLRGADITNREGHELVEMGVGYVPQTRNIFPSLTVEENLEMGLYLRPKLWERRFEFVTDLFPLLGDRRKQRAGSLSGGERQMVAMGRALMMDPSVLFLDEPSAGLVVDALDAGEDLVLVHRRQAGVGIVMVEQNARRCLQICHRGYVLDQGRNAYTGTGDELLNDPKVIELYLGTLAKVK